jgi:hypothetical protein
MFFNSFTSEKALSTMRLARDIDDMLFDEPPLEARPTTKAKRVETKGTPTVRQYLLHLNADTKALTRDEAANAVIKATPAEMQRLAASVAKLRGRYLARVIDLGSAERTTITESEAIQLRRARELYEEVNRGFAELKGAIEGGEIPLEGVRPE